MRLVYPSMNMEIDLTEKAPNILIIESSELFSGIVENLWIQSEGGEGEFILSEKDKIMKLDKKLSFIVNPFSVSCNDKKILNKIYSEMSGIAKESYYELETELNSMVVSYIDEVANRLPYPIEYDLDLNLTGLFKLYDVHIDEEYSEITDKIVSYIKLMHQVCGIEIFTFLNLKQYLSSEKISELYKECEYEDVRIIDIEGYDNGNRVNSEKYVIIDKDLCVVHA